MPRSRTEIGGKWLVRCGDHRFTVELIAEEPALRGSVLAADGSITPIQIGVVSEDAFLFETKLGGTRWLWSGEFTPSGLKGRRENVQTGKIETFAAQPVD